MSDSSEQKRSKLRTDWARVKAMFEPLSEEDRVRVLDQMENAARMTHGDPIFWAVYPLPTLILGLNRAFQAGRIERIDAFDLYERFMEERAFDAGLAVEGALPDDVVDKITAHPFYQARSGVLWHRQQAVKTPPDQNEIAEMIPTGGSADCPAAPRDAIARQLIEALEDRASREDRRWLLVEWASSSDEHSFRAECRVNPSDQQVIAASEDLGGRAPASSAAVNDFCEIAGQAATVFGIEGGWRGLLDTMRRDRNFGYCRATETTASETEFDTDSTLSVSADVPDAAEKRVEWHLSDNTPNNSEFCEIRRVYAACADYLERLGRRAMVEVVRATDAPVTLATSISDAASTGKKKQDPFAAESDACKDSPAPCRSRRENLNDRKATWKKRGLTLTDEMIGTKVFSSWKSRYPIQKWAADDPKYSKWDFEIYQVLLDDHAFDDQLNAVDVGHK